MPSPILRALDYLDMPGRWRHKAVRGCVSPIRPYHYCQMCITMQLQVTLPVERIATKHILLLMYISVSKSLPLSVRYSGIHKHLVVSSPLLTRNCGLDLPHWHPTCSSGILAK